MTAPYFINLPFVLVRAACARHNQVEVTDHGH